jgi:uncharacterized GH25 family protein
MKTRLMVLALGVVLSVAFAAQAHFVWVAVDKDKSGQTVANVWFSELAEPDSADLLDKILMIQVTGQGADLKPRPATVKKMDVGTGGGGALVGQVPADTKALSAQIKYGVISRGDKSMLLQYYAKFLDSSASDLKKLARDERLTLDVVPHVTDKGYSLEILFQGKPVAGSDLVLHDPAGMQTEAKSNEQGRVELITAKPGLYSIRAKWVVEEKGKEGDKEYGQVNHYCTLALRVVGK